MIINKILMTTSGDISHTNDKQMYDMYIYHI